MGELQRLMVLKKAAAQRIAASESKGAGGGAGGSAGEGGLGGAGDLAAGGGLPVQELTQDQLIGQGRRAMDEADASLERSKKVVETTINIGAETAAALQGQTKKMEAVVNELDEIEFTLKKAKTLLRDLGRALATDRCIACFMMLVVLGVVAIIVLKVTKKDNDMIQIPGEEKVAEVADELAGKGRRLLAHLMRGAGRE